MAKRMTVKLKVVRETLGAADINQVLVFVITMTFAPNAAAAYARSEAAGVVARFLHAARHDWVSGPSSCRSRLATWPAGLGACSKM